VGACGAERKGEMLEIEKKYTGISTEKQQIILQLLKNIKEEGDRTVKILADIMRTQDN
tara:strand:+ start:251 stop:424 length:174 start_codon:yes stop_codon:yes gene_type:complete